MNVCANDCIGGHIDLSNIPWIHSLQHNQPTADTSTTLHTKTQTYVTTRYDYLQAQSAAEQEMHDRTAAQLDTYNRKIREMRREIQELLAENQQLQGFKVQSIYFKIMH